MLKEPVATVMQTDKWKHCSLTLNVCLCQMKGHLGEGQLWPPRFSGSDDKMCQSLKGGCRGACADTSKSETVQLVWFCTYTHGQRGIPRAIWKCRAKHSWISGEHPASLEHPSAGSHSKAPINDKDLCVSLRRACCSCPAAVEKKFPQNTPGYVSGISVAEFGIYVPSVLWTALCVCACLCTFGDYS